MTPEQRFETEPTPLPLSPNRSGREKTPRLERPEDSQRESDPDGVMTPLLTRRMKEQGPPADEAG